MGGDYGLLENHGVSVYPLCPGAVYREMGYDQV